MPVLPLHRLREYKRFWGLLGVFWGRSELCSAVRVRRNSYVLAERGDGSLEVIAQVPRQAFDGVAGFPGCEVGITGIAAFDGYAVITAQTQAVPLPTHFHRMPGQEVAVQWGAAGGSNGFMAYPVGHVHFLLTFIGVTQSRPSIYLSKFTSSPKCPGCLLF